MKRDATEPSRGSFRLGGSPLSGVDVNITEIDVGGSGSAQTNTFGQVVRACLAVPRCTSSKGDR
ncbi:hypothetical protein [Amycolatopsis sp. NPDC003861]